MEIKFGITKISQITWHNIWD